MHRHDHGLRVRCKRGCKSATAGATVILCALALAHAAAAAQQPAAPSHRFFVGAHIAHTSWKAPLVDGDSTARGRDSGFGFGMSAGYALTTRLALYLNGGAARMNPDAGGDDYTLAHGDIGLRYTIGNWAVRPSVDVAFSGRLVDIDTDDITELRGGGLSLGIGARYFLSPAFALDARARRTFGNLYAFDDDGVEIDVNVNETPSVRFSLGVEWYPSW